MDIFYLALFMAAVFGLCRLVDILFTRIFRSKPQHKSGRAVRLSPHVGGIGVGVFLLGLMAVLFGGGQGWILIAGGVMLLLLGIGLVVYYLSFGVYYDEEGFLFSALGRRAIFCRYETIKAQRLYNAGGKLLIELHMEDGNTIQLPAGMKGREAFLDYAYEGWVRQKHLAAEELLFHDADNSVWFPTLDPEE
jgi:hypothetical protein